MGDKVAKDIFADLGEPLPSATEEELATFERGKEVFNRRFLAKDGLGPEFNVTFCGSCHEKPVIGGSAARYRNFLLVGETTSGTFTPTGVSGIQTHYTLSSESRVATDSSTNTVATRNPIPFFGAGLINEILEEEILKNADEEDENNDGISGRPNFAQATTLGPRILARFGRKAQVSSLEGFVRAPLFNHMGITTNPLPGALRDNLPVLVSLQNRVIDFFQLASFLKPFSSVYAQGGLPIPENSRDDDGVADPELSADDLFDLVSFVMLMAAPKPSEPTSESEAGESLFKKAKCSSCHTPTLKSPRGLIPLFSDLLIHDMGEDLADGIVMEDASGSEFRTQPLWGIVAVGPYLHDGRADTLDEAIRWHGGEAESARDAYLAMTNDEKQKLILFLNSLGGETQQTEGLLASDAQVPEVGAYGGPSENLGSEDADRFQRGRAVFDQDMDLSRGLGTLFNGDSCRACHFEPVIGGAGPIGVNVMRNGFIDSGSVFTAPQSGTMIHKFTVSVNERPEPEGSSNVFEHRQTPHLFGLGLINQIPSANILALEDPNDTNSDGISGRAHILSDSRLGKFGWKANVPSLEEFARDAMLNEMGITTPNQSGLTFGASSDSDETADPEISLEDLSDLVFFMNKLGPPPRTRTDPELEDAGETIFGTIGCTKCHVPSIQTSGGTSVPLYSDLLLHDVAPTDFQGIEDGDASIREFRTPPLWGLSQTAPYLHDGRASTIQEAILQHEGEALTVQQSYESLSSEDQEKVLKFLNSL